jgi:cell division initiation protein
MKITALEIKQQNFEKALRGYDVGEVKAFLNVVSNEWEHIVARNRDLEREIEQMKDRLKHYERVEDALHETLQAAKESSDQRVSAAKKEAKNRIEKAELDAENILREARQNRHQIRQNILSLLNRREEIVRGMKSYLDLAQESLNGFAKDDAGIFNANFDDDGLDTSSSRLSATKPKIDASPVSANLTDTDDLDDILDQLDKSK